LFNSTIDTAFCFPVSFIAALAALLRKTKRNTQVEGDVLGSPEYLPEGKHGRDKSGYNLTTPTYEKWII
jgi:hypothetical protein